MQRTILLFKPFLLLLRFISLKIAQLFRKKNNYLQCEVIYFV